MRLRKVGGNPAERPDTDDTRGVAQDRLHGYCKQGCGACCEFCTLNINPSYLQADVRHWLELHGITLRESAGQVWANIPLPCSALQPDKSCGLYGQAERPQLCSDWPFSQGEIDELDRVAGKKTCTFYFEGVSE